MAIDHSKKEQIRKIFENFIQKRISTIQKLKLNALDINPFLLRILSYQLGLNDAQSIVRWLVQQRLERGTVTSFGNALQEAAKVFSEGTGVEGADILITKDDKHYHIQIKSGPNTVPKDLAVRISQLLRSAQRRNRGSVALYGMCYGSKEHVSNIVKKYLQEEGGIDWISGREFWEFISEDPDCMDEIFNIIDEVSTIKSSKNMKNLKEILEDKIRELTKEFESTYGTEGIQMWNKLLEMNT